MKKVLIIFCLFQSFSTLMLPQSLSVAKNNPEKSEVVLLGEIVYLGERGVNLSTAIHIDRQTVVFRVIDVFKGKMEVEYVKVALQVSDSSPLSTEKFKDGNKFILYLKNKECKSSCVDLTSDWEFNIKPEFQKFEKFPCYFEDSKSIIDTDDKKTEEIRKTYKRNEETIKSN